MADSHTSLAARQATVEAFAKQLGIDADDLAVAADAVWSNLNPQSTSFDRALSVAGAALRAVATSKVAR